MDQIIRAGPSVIAVVQDYSEGTLDARGQIEHLAREHGLRVADMPMAIQAMTNSPEVREAHNRDNRERRFLSTRPLTTLTGEYRGRREGEHVYEVWHSAGSLVTPQGLREGVKQRENSLQYRHQIPSSFLPVRDSEWETLGRKSFSITRVHLDDVKRGDVPKAGTPYTIFVRLKDGPKARGGQLSYGEFMENDVVLMRAGSPENRELLARMYFKEREGEWETLGNYHPLNDIDYTGPKGTLVVLNTDLEGLSHQDISFGTRFLAIAPEVFDASYGSASPLEAKIESTTQEIQ